MRQNLESLIKKKKNPIKENNRSSIEKRHDLGLSCLAGEKDKITCMPVTHCEKKLKGNNVSPHLKPKVDELWHLSDKVLLLQNCVWCALVQPHVGPQCRPIVFSGGSGSTRFFDHHLQITVTHFLNSTFRVKSRTKHLFSPWLLLILVKQIDDQINSHRRFTANSWILNPLTMKRKKMGKF